jgi:hypothetical protein
MLNIMKRTNLNARDLRITKMSVGYIWEPRINKHLTEYGLEYTSVVCIQTLIPWYEYYVYVTVKHLPGKGNASVANVVKNFKIVKMYVRFDEKLKKIETYIHLLARENTSNTYDCINDLNSSNLVLDNRSSHLELLFS